MDAVNAVLKPDGTLIVLIKPQFEARKEEVGRGGIIKDAKIHQEVIERVKTGIEVMDINAKGLSNRPSKVPREIKNFWHILKE